ncbi:MAG: ABC transporter permease [Acidobacteriota bacterium]
MEHWLRDLRHAARSLNARPSFTLVAVLTLALGIGATTGIFSVVWGVLVEPLGYHDESRLVSLRAHSLDDAHSASGHSLRDVCAFTEAAAEGPPSAEVAWWAWQSTTLESPAPARQIRGLYVSNNLFRLLGFEPTLGRGFAATDTNAGPSTVALISDPFWRRVWGADPDVVGRPIRIDGRLVTVIGVLPPGAEFPAASADLWMPVACVAEPGGRFSREERDLQAIARLADEATPGGLEAKLRPISARLAEQYPTTNRGWSVEVRPLRDLFVSRARQPLLLTLGAVGLVLVIACANVANLLLVRAVGRDHETAVYRALGASRGDLVRRSLVESLLLAAIGGGVGLLAAVWLQDLLLTLDPGVIPRREAIHLSWPVFFFAGSVTLLTGILVSLWPLLGERRGPNRSDPLRSGARAGGTRGRERPRLALVAAEVALATALVAAAGLLASTVHRLGSHDPGFDPRGVFSAHILLDVARYGDLDARREYYRRLEDAVRTVPGIEAAALSTATPVPGLGIQIDVPWRSLDGPSFDAAETSRAAFRVITTGYFDTIGVPLVAGRDLSPREPIRSGPDQHASAVISQAFARQLERDGLEPLGARIQVVFGETIDTEIVGIAGDTRFAGLDSTGAPAIFFSHRQIPFLGMAVVARSDLGEAGVARAIERAALSIDPLQPPNSLSSLERELAAVLDLERFAAGLFALFAGVALLLAAIGIYGVFSVWVRDRRSEIGLRVALGAETQRIARWVLARGTRIVAIGLVPGALGAYAAGALLSGVFQGVDGMPLGLLAGVIASLGAVAAVACLLPALRAARVDPTEVLREQ